MPSALVILNRIAVQNICINGNHRRFPDSASIARSMSSIAKGGPGSRYDYFRIPLQYHQLGSWPPVMKVADRFWKNELSITLQSDRFHGVPPGKNLVRIISQ
jgi:hypothetical protein